jgi:hypothetical protein
MTSVCPAVPIQSLPLQAASSMAASVMRPIDTSPSNMPWTRANELAVDSSPVVRHVVSMLGAGNERSEAVIQTLVSTGSSTTLVEALRAAPAVINESMLQALASARDTSTFRVGLRLRPDLANRDLAQRLCESHISSTFLETLLRTVPELRHAVDDAGRTLADAVRSSTNDLRLQGPKLRVIAAERGDA